MKNLIIHLVLAVLLATSSYAAEKLPAFENFPVKHIYTGEPARVDLNSHPKARKYRSMLREHSKEGPNFAGHYTVVFWGCGTACREFAIVDAKTGKVAFPTNLNYVDYHMITDDSEPIEHQLGSRLLVVRGAPNEAEKTGIFYYVWDGRVLKHLTFIQKEWPQ